MINLADPDCHELLADLRRVVQRLALISHAPIQGYNFAPSEVGRGERWRFRVVCPQCRRRGLDSCEHRAPIAHLGQHSGKSGDTQEPRGDIDHHGDFQVGYRQKSDAYFRRKFFRLLRNPKGTKDELLALTLEAEQTLEDWLKTPEYQGAEPVERDSFRWKCLIADFGGSSLGDGDVKRINDLYAMGKTIHRSAIYRYRERYRGLRTKRAA